MPLLDHFHPPLHGPRSWESFHNRWAAALADALNADLLPRDYFADVQTHVGSRVEIDVPTFEAESSPTRRDRGDGGVAVLARPVYVSPAAAVVVPTVFPDEIEILVYRHEGGAILVGAVELVSPANKDRSETRRAFAAKCDSLLQRGVGLVIVDIVTDHRANLHDEWVRLFGHADEFLFPSSPSLYATSYRPSRREQGDQIEVWWSPLAVGTPLPLLPLSLFRGPCVPLDLEATYMETCRRSRLVGPDRIP